MKDQKKEQKEYSPVLEQYQEGVHQELLQDGEYRLLLEKWEGLLSQCEGMFTPCEREFAQECFDVLEEMKRMQARFAYRRGMQDALRMLAWMGMLS